MAYVADPAIVELLKPIDLGNTGMIVQVVDKIIDRLIEAKLAYRMRIPPALVGAHPKNRNTYGISPVEVHALGADIVKLGWSWAACSHAICVEDSNCEVGNFTERLTKQPGLATQLSTVVKYGSLSCSHTNTFLNACIAGIETDESSLQVGGRLSASVLGDNDALLKEAIEKGLQWTVIRADVPSTYPTLCDLVQHAKNASHSIARRESESQLLLVIQEVVEMAGTANIDWARLQTKLLLRHITQADALPSLIAFTKRWGGGVGGMFIRDLRVFHQQHVPSGRIIGSSTFAALADLKLKTEEHSPFFVMAIVKAQGTCPAGKVRNNVCGYITPSEIGSLAGNRKSDMLTANALLQRCHEFVSTVGIQSIECAQTHTHIPLFCLPGEFPGRPAGQNS